MVDRQRHTPNGAVVRVTRHETGLGVGRSVALLLGERYFCHRIYYLFRCVILLEWAVCCSCCAVARECRFLR